MAAISISNRLNALSGPCCLTDTKSINKDMRKAKLSTLEERIYRIAETKNIRNDVEGIIKAFNMTGNNYHQFFRKRLLEALQSGALEKPEQRRALLTLIRENPEAADSMPRVLTREKNFLGECYNALNESQIGRAVRLARNRSPTNCPEDISNTMEGMIREGAFDDISVIRETRLRLQNASLETPAFQLSQATIANLNGENLVASYLSGYSAVKTEPKTNCISESNAERNAFTFVDQFSSIQHFLNFRLLNLLRERFARKRDQSCILLSEHEVNETSNFLLKMFNHPLTKNSLLYEQNATGKNAEKIVEILSTRKLSAPNAKKSMALVRFGTTDIGLSNYLWTSSKKLEEKKPLHDAKKTYGTNGFEWKPKEEKERSKHAEKSKHAELRSKPYKQNKPIYKKLEKESWIKKPKLTTAKRAPKKKPFKSERSDDEKDRTKFMKKAKGVKKILSSIKREKAKKALLSMKNSLRKIKEELRKISNLLKAMAVITNYKNRTVKTHYKKIERETKKIADRAVYTKEPKNVKDAKKIRKLIRVEDEIKLAKDMIKKLNNKKSNHAVRYHIFDFFKTPSSDARTRVLRNSKMKNACAYTRKPS
ncbi:MAG: hypothetical protein QW171_02645 [Candidatus Bilamarchaeaceae archaeon]